jgi:hypothetical protein
LRHKPTTPREGRSLAVRKPSPSREGRPCVASAPLLPRGQPPCGASPPISARAVPMLHQPAPPREGAATVRRKPASSREGSPRAATSPPNHREGSPHAALGRLHLARAALAPYCGMTWRRDLVSDGSVVQWCSRVVRWSVRGEVSHPHSRKCRLGQCGLALPKRRDILRKGGEAT